MTYQERLERRYDVVYWNTTFKLKTLEKNENFWLSPQEEKLEENFPMTQKMYTWTVLERKLILREPE